MIQITRLENCPFYNLNTEKVREFFQKPDLIYLNSFTLGTYMPYAVYGLLETREYLCIQRRRKDSLEQSHSLWTNEDKIKKWRVQEGIRCTKCGDVIYSRYVHDMHSCKCDAVYVDGGKEYLKVSGTTWEHAKIDLIDNTYEIWHEEHIEPEFKDYLVTFTANHTIKIQASSVKDAQEQVENYDLVNILNDFPTETEIKVTKICLAE